MAPQLEFELSDEFLIKFKRCFKLLFKENYPVNDDTLLDKFASLLDAIIKQNEDNVEVLFVSNLKVEKWLTTFYSTWKILNPTVTAFGVNVISALVSNSRGQTILENHNLILKKLLECMKSTEKLSPTIRCSLLILYLKLLHAKSTTFLPTGTELLKITTTWLKDSSMYVSRAAQDVLVCFLCGELTDKRLIEETVSQLIFDVQRHETDLKAAQASLDVIRKLFNSSPTLLSDFEYRNNLETTIFSLIQKINHTPLLIKTCNLYLTLKFSCNDGNFSSFEDEILKIFNILIDKRQIICYIKFTTEYLRLGQNTVLDSSKPVSMLIYLLVSMYGSFHMKDLPWDFQDLSENFVKFAKRLKPSNTVLSCLTSSLIEIHQHFEKSEEKFSLLKVLLSIMTDKRDQILICQIIVDAILKFFDVWRAEKWLSRLKPIDIELLIADCVYLLKINTNSSVFVRLCKLTLRLLVSQSEPGSRWGAIGADLKELLELKCHDPQWETRDGAFEFMAEVVNMSKDNLALNNWWAESNLIPLCIMGIDDEIEYVRASAITVLTDIPPTGAKFQEEAVLKCTEKLLQDPESVVKRSAANFLTRRFEFSYFNAEDLKLLYPAFVKCCRDLDWEVKLTAVKFWEILLKRNETHLLDDEVMFDNLNSCGLFKAVFTLINDEDSSVRNQAVLLLKKVQKFIPDSITVSEVENKMAEVVPEVNLKSLPRDDSIVESVLDTIDCDIVMSKKFTPVDEAETQNLKAALSEIQLKLGEKELNRLKFGAAEVKATTDLYELNPILLLDDILVGNYESDQDEDVIIDCY